MKILGLVCARKGSKGLKNKNFKQFHNKPLIYWSLIKLKKLELIHKKIVSTDDEKIIKLTKDLKLDIIFKRPKYLSNSSASKIDVWKHAFKKACEYYDCEFDGLLDIDCSNPLQRFENIKNLINWSIKQNKNKVDFDVTLFVSKSRKNPYFNMLEKKGDYYKISKNQNNIYSRQAAPKVYDHIAGSYFVTKKFLKSKRYLNNAKVLGYEIPRKESFDIDDILDFKLSEYLFKERL